MDVSVGEIMEEESKKKTSPKGKDDLISRILDGVEAYNTATEEIRKERAEDFRFNFGDQWLAHDREKNRREKRPTLTFNITGPVVNFVAGYQQEREQDFRAFPRGAEDEHIGRLTTSLMKCVQCDATKICGEPSSPVNGFLC